MTTKTVDMERLLPTRSANREIEILEDSEDDGSGLSSHAYWHFEKKVQKSRKN